MILPCHFQSTKKLSKSVGFRRSRIINTSGSILVDVFMYCCVYYITRPPIWSYCCLLLSSTTRTTTSLSCRSSSSFSWQKASVGWTKGSRSRPVLSKLGYNPVPGASALFLYIENTMPVTTRRQQQREHSGDPVVSSDGDILSSNKKRRLSQSPMYAKIVASDSDDGIDPVVSSTIISSLVDRENEKIIEKPNRQSRRRLDFDDEDSVVGRKQKDDATTSVEEEISESTAGLPVEVVNTATRTMNVVTPEPITSYETVDTDIDKNSKSIRKASSSKTKKKTSTTSYADFPSGDERKHGTVSRPPDGWEDIYSLVEELRADRTAPCDTDGCEALVNRVNTTPANQRFQILIALMLSSQTKDAVVGNAIRSMQQDNVLDIDSIVAMDDKILNSYIQKVGFHNTKTKHILQVVQILQETYNGDIPPTAEDMVRDLPGVGPKMAYICENAAWNTTTGIGIDTHMHRLFNLLKWTSRKNSKTAATTTPEQTRISLESWLPKEKWSDVNLLWVGFGQEIQQYKSKILHKALYNCSRPADALRLLQRCGLDYIKEGTKLGLQDEIQRVISNQQDENATA